MTTTRESRRAASARARLRPTRISRLAGIALLCAAGPGSPAAAVERPPDRDLVYRTILERFDELVPGGRVSPSWLGDGSSFWYAEGDPEHRVIVRVDPEAGTKAPMFDVQRLRAALAKAIGHEPPGTGVPFDRFSELPDGRIGFELDGVSLVVDLSTSEVTRSAGSDRREAPAAESAAGTFQRLLVLADPMAVPDVPSPDGRSFATVRDGNLALRSAADGRVTALTDDAEPDVGWDLESGRLVTGADGRPVRLDPWSPDGRTLFAIKIDRRHVPKLPRVHQRDGATEVEWVYAQRAGGPLDRAELYLVDVHGRNVVPLELGDTTDRYFVLLTWLPDSSEVWFARCSRDLRRVDVMAADRSGRVRTVLTEASETFVRHQMDVVYGGRVGFTLLPEGAGFIWESERDGWNHLYRYALDGRLLNPITRGDFPVLDLERVDLDEGLVYFTGHAEPRLYDTHLYRVPLAGGDIRRLTRGEGRHSVRFSPSGRYFVDTFSTAATPPVTELRSASGELVMEFGRADLSALEAVGWTAPEEFVVKAADGETDLWGVMLKPYDFDPSRRYPVVELIYGGPQVAFAHRNFGGFFVVGGTWVHYAKALTQLGFVVISLDARGTPERSKAFQDVVYGRWGVHEIPDHAAALRQLGERHRFFDLSRVGVFGHSWGGTFAFTALVEAPDLYRAAVVSAPGLDLRAVMLYEPYLGMPQDNPAAYDHGSLLTRAPQVAGDLLMAVGTLDTFTFADTMRMTRALIEAGVQHDLVLLPGESHTYEDPGMGYFLERQTRFFEEHLRPYSGEPTGDAGLDPASRRHQEAPEDGPRDP